ncbi:MAG: transcription termination/antitermination protein NusA [Chloroflexota bacterium]
MLARTEFARALTQLATEKNLPLEVVVDLLKRGIVTAFKRELGTPNVRAEISVSAGTIRVYVAKTVVEKVEDPRTQLSLAEARRIKPDVKVGQTIEVEVPQDSVGRIAAQTARQVFLQGIKEAEREDIYRNYLDQVGEIVTGIVQRVDSKQVTLDLGKVEAVLPASDQIPGEVYRPGQRLKALLLEVRKTPKGPQLIVSRTHKDFLKRLLELEVPEIYNGIVEIKAIAREPGSRSKVAVWSRQPGVDARGACIGLRGVRIQNIVNELNGEKIDIVLWNPDPAIFVAEALSPAQVLSVEINEAEKTATVIVPDRQLSLAIGKEGQNARLAARLTGWRIDIKAASVARAERLVKEAEAAAATQVAVEVAPPAPEPAPVPEVTPEPEVVPEPEPVVAAEMAAAPAAEEAAPEPVAVAPEPVLEPPRVLRFAEDLQISRELDVKRKKGEEERAPPGKPKKAKRPRVTVELEEEEAYEELLRRIR